MNRNVNLVLTDEDLSNSDNLRLARGNDLSRTEVIRRALSLLHWAFVTKSGDELIVQRRGLEVGRISWTEASQPDMTDKVQKPIRQA